MSDFFQTIKNFTRKLVFSKELQIFCVTFLIHAFFVVVFNFAHIRLLEGTGDNLLYRDLGTQIAQMLHAGTYRFGDVYPHHWYPLFLGIVFYVFGSSMLLGSFINAAIAAGTAVLIYKLLKSYNVSEIISFWGPIIITNLYASFMYHSSILLKESWIIFLLIGVLYLARKISQGKNNRVFLFMVTIVAWILLRNLRFFIGFAAITGFFFEWFLNANFPLKKKIGWGIAMLLVVNAAAFFLSGDGLFRAQSIFDAMHVSFISTTRMYSERATSANHVAIFQSSDSEDSAASGAVTFSVHGFFQGFANVIFGPFPWQLAVRQYLPTLLDSLFAYGAIIGMIMGVACDRLKNWRAYVPWLVVGAILVAAVTLGSDNIGADIRQRIPAVMVIALIACLAAGIRFKNHEKFP